MARRLAARPAATRRRGPTENEVLEWIPDGVIVSDLGGRIVFVNRQAEEMTGYSRGELLGSSLDILVPDGLHGGPDHQRRAYTEADTGPRFLGRREHDYVVRRKDGSTVQVEIALGPVGSGVHQHTIAVLRDIVERRKLEHALEHRALHDPLTDLANRTLFYDRFRQSLHAARRENAKVALVMLDLDAFKEVNDLHGHAVGDEALKKVASRLRLGLRATDTAARLGGDEFAWILPKIADRPTVEQIVRARLAGIQEPIQVGDLQLKLGASAGIALYPDDGHDVDALMKRADTALYTVKKSGGGKTLYG